MYQATYAKLSFKPASGTELTSLMRYAPAPWALTIFVTSTVAWYQKRVLLLVSGTLSAPSAVSIMSTPAPGRSTRTLRSTFVLLAYEPQYKRAYVTLASFGSTSMAVLRAASGMMLLSARAVPSVG